MNATTKALLSFSSFVFSIYKSNPQPSDLGANTLTNAPTAYPIFDEPRSSLPMASLLREASVHLFEKPSASFIPI